MRVRYEVCMRNSVVMNSGGLMCCMYIEFQDDRLEQLTNIKESTSTNLRGFSVGITDEGDSRNKPLRLI
jgi:hypothetical protein